MVKFIDKIEFDKYLSGLSRTFTKGYQLKLYGHSKIFIIAKCNPTVEFITPVLLLNIFK